MRTFLVCTLMAVLSLTVSAQQPPAPGRGAGAAAQPRGNPADTEFYEPVPPIVTPGALAGPMPPPSDAIVLFDGSNLNEWVSVRDKSPAGWTVANGVVTVNKPSGNIETKRTFT